MSRLIESAVDNVGRIITDLRPSILDHQGLWAALDWQAHEFVQSAELALDWQMEVADAPPLPEPAAMAVFRIFQEMLSNVGRHARASRSASASTADGPVLRIAVHDDGVGADARRLRGGQRLRRDGHARAGAALRRAASRSRAQPGHGSTFRCCICRCR